MFSTVQMLVMETGFEYDASSVGQLVTKHCCFLGILFFPVIRGDNSVRAVHRQFFFLLFQDIPILCIYAINLEK